MTKSTIIRVISRLKFLSDKSAEEQAQWLDTINQNSKDLSDLKVAVKEMSARNGELTQKLDDSEKSKKQLEDLCKRISEENETLRFKVQIKERQISSINTNMQTVETELEGGAKIRIQVPKPPMVVPTEMLAKKALDNEKLASLLDV